MKTFLQALVSWRLRFTAQKYLHSQLQGRGGHINIGSGLVNTGSHHVTTHQFQLFIQSNFRVTLTVELRSLMLIKNQKRPSFPNETTNLNIKRLLRFIEKIGKIQRHFCVRLCTSWFSNNIDFFCDLIKILGLFNL